MALCTVLELLRVAAVALSPITPALSQRVYLQLGYTDQQYKVRYSQRGTAEALCCIVVAFSPRIYWVFQYVWSEWVSLSLHNSCPGAHTCRP